MLSTLKLIVRRLRRHKIETFINAAGMSLGLAGFLLIATYVRHELSYDKFHEKGDRLYRLIAEIREPKGTTRTAPTPAPWAPAMKAEYPEIEKAVRVYFLSEALLAAGDKRFYENRTIFAEAGFFDIFSFPVVRGDPASLLEDPRSIVLTESTARKYFGEADPLGKTLTMNNAHEFLVTGVVRDVPQNSHFHFDVVASFSAPLEKISGFKLDQWYAYFVQTYVLGRPGLSPRAFEEKAKNFVSVRAPRTDGIAARPLLQPVAAIHLDNGTARNIEPGVSPTSLMVILLIGLFILAVAAINFVNMSVARAFRRIREVGIRKVTGASRGLLIRQFLLESLFQTYLGLFLALFLIALVQPFLAGLVQKNIAFVVRPDLFHAACLLGFPLLLGLLAGLYPALFLSRQEPVHSMKNVMVFGRKRRPTSAVRNALVVVQFAISAFLIIGTVLIQNQYRHMITADMGFRRDTQILIRLPENRVSDDRLSLIKSEFLKHAGVGGVTAAFGNPVGNSFGSNVYPAANAEPISAVFKIVDADFIGHFDIPVLAGRGFSPDNAADTWKSFVINQNLVRALGYASPAEALGKSFRIGLNDIQGTVVGVLQDFRTESAYAPILPTVLLYAPRLCTEIVVRVGPGQIPSVLSHLESVWKGVYPLHPFQYTFLDDSIRSFYVREERNLKIVAVSAGAAILISCLGLFGLALFEAARRVREIGIRKVLGASTRQIVALQTWGFVKLVLLGNALAWPAAYLALNRWLRNFSLRILLGPGPFTGAVGLTMAVALATIGIQAFRAALANPRESLRCE